MDVVTLIPVAVFLPLFPFSMAFNALFERFPHPLWRSAMLLGWPLIGIYLLPEEVQSLPGWITIWASATAILYGFRLIAIRDMGLWIGFLATSAWCLLWISIHAGMGGNRLYLSALGFSVPLVMLVIMAAHIETRFGAAYTGLYGGLAVTTPRLSGVLVFATLAAIATPVFPAFFIMLHNLVGSAPGIVVAILVVWLLWTWAGARLIQGLIVGPEAGEQVRDISRGLTWLYALLMVMLVLPGFYLIGGRL